MQPRDWAKICRKHPCSADRAQADLQDVGDRRRRGQNSGEPVCVHAFPLVSGTRPEKPRVSGCAVLLRGPSEGKPQRGMPPTTQIQHLPSITQLRAGETCSENFTGGSRSSTWQKLPTGAFKERKQGLPGGAVVKNSACQRRGHGFEPWSRRIAHAAEQLSPVRHNY